MKNQYISRCIILVTKLQSSVWKHVDLFVDYGVYYEVYIRGIRRRKERI